MGSASSALASLLLCAGGGETVAEDEEGDAGANTNAPVKEGAILAALTDILKGYPDAVEEPEEQDEIGAVFDRDAERSPKKTDGGKGAGGGVPGSPPETTVISAAAPSQAKGASGAPSGAGVAKFESQFLGEFVLMLKQGFVVKKHGRLGAPKDRLVRLQGDDIVWTSTKSSFRRSFDRSPSGMRPGAETPTSPGAKSAGISVAEIVDVRRGTFTGRPRPPGVDPDRCLSLVTTHRAVNLELPDNEVRELCVDGFGLLMNRARKRS